MSIKCSLHPMSLYLLAISADILVSSVLCTYYYPDGQWIASYSIFTSGIDLVVLASLRSLVFLAIASENLSPSKNSRVWWLVPLFSYVFTLIKVLCLGEDMTLLSELGVILSLLWSLTATAVTGYSIYKSTISQKDATSREDQEDSDEEDSGDEEFVSASEQIKFILNYCKEQWMWYLAGFALMFIQVPAEVLEPSAKGYVIDTAVGKKGYYTLLIAILYQFGAGFLSNIFGGLSSACMHYATSLVGRQMKLDLFKSLVNKDIAFFDANPSGKLVSRLTDDCDTASGAVANNLTTFIQSVVLAFSSLSFILIYSWRMTVLALITSPLSYIIFEVYGNFHSELSKSTREQASKITQIATDVLSTVRTVRSFACERREIKRFSDALDKTLNCEMKSSLGSAGFSWTCSMAQNLTEALLLLYGGHLVLSGKMSSGVLVTYTLYLDQLEGHIYSIVWTVMDVMDCATAAKQVFINMKNVSEHQMKGVEKPNIDGAIEMDSVNFTYPSRSTKEVLKGVDIKIESGKTTAFVGPSGGGKSTIVSLIQQFYTPSSGSIRIDGVPIARIEHEYYHEKVSIVAQEPVLYDCSIRDNILYGCEWATDEDMKTAAQMANAHDFVTQLDDGYETNCGERGAQLSGGQKQRIAIARALVRRPAVLILDEATSALDAHSEGEIQEALRSLLEQIYVQGHVSPLISSTGQAKRCSPDLAAVAGSQHSLERIPPLLQGAAYRTLAALLCISLPTKPIMCICVCQFNRITGQLTVIVVAHRLSTIKDADRIYVVDNGTIVQSGTHTELLEDVDGPYYSLVAKQRNNM
ncbi:hypothetical protein Y032_0264g613 [Ancylostoma ceylanicum]|uniref:ABC transporter, ATP-binding protein n=1 Tax=Ancylostoma ceylanicum TaxID=53326 RepID=A0A016SAP5_9BILA|nr:hypothetical protein Y032_0264g613 [Ancylostoma ceylanicum]